MYTSLYIIVLLCIILLLFVFIVFLFVYYVIIYYHIIVCRPAAVATGGGLYILSEFVLVALIKARKLIYSLELETSGKRAAMSFASERRSY